MWKIIVWFYKRGKTEFEFFRVFFMNFTGRKPVYIIKLLFSLFDKFDKATFKIRFYVIKEKEKKNSKKKTD